MVVCGLINSTWEHVTCMKCVTLLSRYLLLAHVVWGCPISLKWVIQLKHKTFFARPLWANPELYPVVCALHGGWLYHIKVRPKYPVFDKLHTDCLAESAIFALANWLWLTDYSDKSTKIGFNGHCAWKCARKCCLRFCTALCIVPSAPLYTLNHM